MTIPFSQVKPASLKMKVLPRYPAAYRAGPGIAIDQTAGVVTTSVDFTNLVVDPNTPATGLYIAAWNDTTKTFKLYTSTALIGPTGLQGPSGTPGDAVNYATKATVVASTIPAPILYLRIAGFYAAGDSGGGLYVRKTALDTNAFGFQSVDGAWWQLAPEPNGFIYAEQCGAKGDGTTDDTAAIQAAANASTHVGLKSSEYRVSATIVLKPSAVLKSFRLDSTMLKRSTVYGPTVTCGNTTPGVNAGAVVIDGVYFNQIPTFNNGSTYVAGTSTSITNKETAPHIAIYKGQDCVVKNCRINGAGGGIFFYGCSYPIVDNCAINGMYDLVLTGLQECFANIAAFELVDSVSTHYINTEVVISHCRLGGAGHTPSRSKTVGNVTSNIEYNFGPNFGFYTNCSEGVTIHDCYIGGQATNCIRISPQNISGTIRIHDNFIDSASAYSIRIEANGSNVPSFIFIHDNYGAGYGMDDGFLWVADLGGVQPSAVNVVIHDNNVQHYLKAPFKIEKVHGGSFTGNVVRAYNYLGATNADAANSAGLIVSSSDDFHAVGNVYGGGINDPIISNNCQWGSYFAGCTNSDAALERAKNLGMAGGAVCNITQTYPT